MRNARRFLICSVLCFPLLSCMPVVVEPIDRAVDRASPLGFGLHVTPDPDENPIDPPERFEGYHVGLDYEVGSDEVEADVPVYAICNGEVVYSGSAEGYGGLLVHRCHFRGEPVTVLYGHLATADLPKEGSQVRAGDLMGVLAPARSEQSGGNRKHLHLGIHRGSELDVRGYVQEKDELQEFLDPLRVIPYNGVEDAVHMDIEPYWKTNSPRTTPAD